MDHHGKFPCGISLNWDIKVQIINWLKLLPSKKWRNRFSLQICICGSFRTRKKSFRTKLFLRHRSSNTAILYILLCSLNNYLSTVVWKKKLFFKLAQSNRNFHFHQRHLKPLLLIKLWFRATKSWWTPKFEAFEKALFSTLHSSTVFASKSRLNISVAILIEKKFF